MGHTALGLTLRMVVWTILAFPILKHPVLKSVWLILKHSFALGADARVMAVARIVVGVMWLSNLGWKTPPHSGVLHNYARDAVTHPVFAPYAWLTEHVILPHFGPFAWVVLFVESLLAASADPLRLS